jgi:hypothetical protein
VKRIFRIFKQICNKVWNPSEIESFIVDLAINFALMEMHFPPSFFDIMIHLLYHLVDELDLCGPMVIKWMYLFEMYMKTLKNYVHNMARLEDSMVERYITDECFSFIIEYLQRFEVVQRHIWDVEEEERDVNEVLEGNG